MPLIRKIGNISLTFISRIITDYFELKDVTNGMIGLKISKFNFKKLDLIQKKFFFEQDLIFHFSLKNLNYIK